MSAASPLSGEHGRRVSPPRFCDDCGTDVSAACYCCAPTRGEDGKRRCNPCWLKRGSMEARAFDFSKDLLLALEELVEAHADGRLEGRASETERARALIAEIRGDK